ncbi:MAG: class I SAM-dependent methyltransferase [Thaumarchaeota archaeon]|nr:class I SAM-dependent methyltransferase [Nitrososphaerota archaeon]
MIPVISIVLFSIAGFLAYFFVSGFIWGAGYFPTSRDEIEKAIRLMNLKEGSTFFDLGSGFGRMLVSVARECKVNCVGVEIDPLKCTWTRLVVRSKHLSSRVRVVRQNLLSADISKADGIFVFLSNETNIMKKLSQKIEREAKLGVRVVSYIHRFDGWTPEVKEGDLYLYRPKKIAEDEEGISTNS